MDKIIGQLHRTDEYSKFKFNKYNRGGKVILNEAWARKMGESMEKYGQLEPIVVDEDFEVIPGHHRLRGAEMLGLMIDYIVRKDMDRDAVAHVHHMHKNWTSDNFVDYYSSKRNPNYKTFVEQRDKTGLSVGSLYILFAGQPPKRDKDGGLLGGELVITPQMFLAYKKRWKLIEPLLKVRDGYWNDVITHTKFLQVLLLLIEHPDYNQEHMVRRLNHVSDSVELTTINRLEHGAAMVERFYNKNLRGGNKIYLVQEYQKQQDSRKEKRAEI